MGQSTSRQEPSSPTRHTRPRSTLPRPLSSISQPRDEPPTTSHSRRRSFLARAGLDSAVTRDGSTGGEPTAQEGVRRRRLHRSSTSFRSSIADTFARHRPTSASTRTPQHRVRSPLSSPPQVDITPLDEEEEEEEEAIPPLRRARPLSRFHSQDHAEQSSPINVPSPRPHHLRTRSPSDASPMLSFRRRSPMRRPEDTPAMLGRLLQAAAAATALSMTGGSSNNATFEGLASGDRTIDGDDGSFNGFLQSLRNGNLASTLNQNESARPTGEDVHGQPPASLDFFRMFRFRSNNNSQDHVSPSSPPTSSLNPDAAQTTAGGGNTEGAEPDRMIPVLIVGIRALNDRDASQERNDGMPSFLDSLGNFPTTFNAEDEGPPPAGIEQVPRARRRRSRRSTVGSLNFFNTDRDDTQQQQHQEPPRPATSQASPSESPPGPLPPPTTPASPGLSAFSSGSNTPTRRSSISSTADLAHSQSRRGSLYRRLTGNTLEPTLEEQGSSQESPNVNPRGLRRRPRIHSWADGPPRHDTRRNGVLMEPSTETPSERSSTRSWIIYILGGNYPENHPILTTPSLFSDNPNYEDMLLLSNLLGPVKPPVANAEDVATAGGTFKVDVDGGQLVAEEVEGQTRVLIPPTEQCLICLSPYVEGEEARRLVKCTHLFHRECIDQWLTTGRNSCPLCRTQGVDEKATTEDSNQTTADGPSNEASAPSTTPIASDRPEV